MSGDWRDWKWDPTLFAGAAAFYDRGRLPYAPGLADALADALGLDGTGRLLDVGCGPGTVARRLAHLFAEVVGVDADADMLREAARLTTLGNARWVELRAESLPAGLGHVRVVTFAASFHWMDRPRVASAVRTMLDPGGAVVHIDTLQPYADQPFVPHEHIRALRSAYLGADRRAGASIRNTSPDDEDDVFRGAGFSGPEIMTIPDGRVLTRSVDDIIAETFSQSSSAPHLFGNRVGAFEADLRALLADAGGTFEVTLPDTRCRIWR